MKLLLRFALLGTLLLFGTTSVSAQSKVGTTAAQFLGIGVGPRAVGMGEAFVAVADDASSMYWNPGGLSRKGRSQMIGAHTSWLVETDLNWVGLSIAIDENNAFGFALTQLDYGEEDVNTVEYPEGTGARWTAQDLLFSASYASNLTDRFSIGGSFKYVRQQIWNESATTIAFDLGLLFDTPLEGLRIGASMTNFGGTMKMEGKDLTRRIDLDPNVEGNNQTIVADLKTSEWDIPLFFRAGASYLLVNTELMSFLVAVDAVRPSDNDEYINAGGEFSYKHVFFVRLGYKKLLLNASEEGLTAGLGVDYPISETFSAAIDYTYQDFGIFKSIQTITLGVTF